MKERNINQERKTQTNNKATKKEKILKRLRKKKDESYKIRKKERL